MAIRAQSGNKEITLGEILFAAPEVAAVIARARFTRRSDWHAYCRFKAEISIYVGWYSRLPYLRSSYAYELAIEAMFRAMGSRRRRRAK